MPTEFMPLPLPMTASQLLSLFGPKSGHWDGTCEIVIDKYDNIYITNNHVECAFSLWKSENPGGTKRRLFNILQRYTQPLLYLVEEYKMTLIFTSGIITHSKFYTDARHMAVIDEIIEGGMLPEEIRGNVQQIRMQ